MKILMMRLFHFIRMKVLKTGGFFVQRCSIKCCFASYSSSLGEAAFHVGQSKGCNATVFEPLLRELGYCKLSRGMQVLRGVKIVICTRIWCQAERGSCYGEASPKNPKEC
uniref:Phospholipase D p1-like isoform X2 n=1 Tax=Rhizophora mucronata TaxID=61149 RepID=A0A2P2PN56_RHIMU